jgi:hypothetical protein
MTGGYVVATWIAQSVQLLATVKLLGNGVIVQPECTTSRAELLKDTQNTRDFQVIHRTNGVNSSQGHHSTRVRSCQTLIIWSHEVRIEVGVGAGPIRIQRRVGTRD